MSEHIFKVLLNEEQTEYIYKQAKDRGNISCAQMIAEMVEKQMPKKPKKLKSKDSQWLFCPECRRILQKDDYCPECGQAIDWNKHFEASE